MSGLAVRIRREPNRAGAANAQTLLEGIKELGSDRLVAEVRGPYEIAHAQFRTTPGTPSELAPVQHPTLDMWVIADARIDYTDELRASLKSAGCSFEPIGDSALILAAHEVWGDDAQLHLTGDFSYVIHDGAKLLAARDVIGCRPLWWAVDDGEVVIASTIRCVLDQLDHVPAPNETYIADLLSIRLARNDYTAYQSVHRLPPGSRMICRPGQPHAIDQVDQLNLGEMLDVDQDEAANLLRQALAEAVHERIPSVGSVACELSGGLDSSTIVGLVAAQNPDEPVVTLSNVFPGSDCDESRFIDAVNERFSAASHKLQPLSMTPLDIRAESARRRDLVGGPSEIFPLRSLAKGAGHRVVLTGQGGDHALGHNGLVGLDILADFGIRSFWKHLAGADRRIQTLRSLARHRLGSASLSPRFGGLVNRFLERRRMAQTEWLTSGLKEHLSPFEYELSRPKSNSAWNRASRLRNYTNPDTVRVFEGWHQSSGGLVDLRHPFLDRRFIELALRLPGDLLFRDAERRYMHRRAFDDLLPEIVKIRTDKAEFSSLYRSAVQVNAPDGFHSLSTHQRGWTNPAMLNTWHHTFVQNEETAPVWPIWQALAVSCWLDSAVEQVV